MTSQVQINFIGKETYNTTVLSTSEEESLDKKKNNSPLQKKKFAVLKLSIPYFVPHVPNAITKTSSAAGRWHELDHRNYFG